MVTAGDGAVASYVHGAVAPGLGKIGVLVGLESGGDAERLQAIGKNLAMHISFANPQSVDIGSVEVHRHAFP